jgi:hypothetical protein
MRRKSWLRRSDPLAKAAKHGSADARRSTRMNVRVRTFLRWYDARHVRCGKALSRVKATDEHGCTRISVKRFPTPLLCFQLRTTAAGPPPRTRRERYPCASVFIRGLKPGLAAPVPPPKCARSGIGSPLWLRASVVDQAEGVSNRPAFAVPGGLCVSTRVVRPKFHTKQRGTKDSSPARERWVIPRALCRIALVPRHGRPHTYFPFAESWLR